MRMPWEDDINWGNTATTIVKGEPIDMGVYINKAELLKELSVIQDRPVRSAMQIIKILPTIDLVRCEECDKGEETISGKIRCKLNSWGLVWEKTDFCSYGERRSDEKYR